MQHWNTKNNEIQNLSQILIVHLKTLPTVLHTIIDEYYGESFYIQIGTELVNTQNEKKYFVYNIEFSDMKIYKDIQNSCLEYFIETLNSSWKFYQSALIYLYHDSKIPFCEDKDIILKFNYNSKHKHKVKCECALMVECGEICDCGKWVRCKNKCNCDCFCDFCSKYDVIQNI